MNYLSDFSDRQICQNLSAQIAAHVPRRPLTFMEVCGTHTMAIFKHGLRELLPENITLLSGPGCPVCVTPNPPIDAAIALAKKVDERICLTTFGDMLRVPGSSSSLEQVRAQGGDVRIVYSPLDALTIAEREPQKSVVFFGVGFETTTPTVAASVIDAQHKRLNNYFMISAHKLMPPAIKMILESQDVKLDGLLLPGHVSIMIGRRGYEWIADSYHMPCAIAGFEPVDMLQAILALVKQIEQGTAAVENCYPRVVQETGSRAAQCVIDEVFEPCDSEWRGLEMIPRSGLRLRSNYRRFDALEHFEVRIAPPINHPGCLCGDILRGVRIPSDCPLFGAACTPQMPVGACMVSSEGTCAAYYKYQRRK